MKNVLTWNQKIKILTDVCEYLNIGIGKDGRPHDISTPEGSMEYLRTFDPDVDSKIAKGVQHVQALAKKYKKDN